MPAANIAQGFFSTTSEYVLETLLFIVLQIFSVFFSFYLIKDTYIKLWGKRV